MTESNEQEHSTLKFGQYTIELTDGPSAVYRIDQEGNKQWIASCPDPEIAMDVVEGMVLVEQKRFYYPDSKPTVNFQNTATEATEVKEEVPVPSFLKRKKD